MFSLAPLSSSFERFSSLHQKRTSSDELLHLVKWPVDALNHLLKALAVGDLLGNDLLVNLPSLGVAHAKGVDHVVV